MKSYRDLEIYKLSYELAVKVRRFSLTFPKFELYEEGSQVRRSAKGVTACIVEGYGRRRYKAEFVKFLTYAHASCDETILHLNFIRDTYKTAESTIQSIMESYEELGRKINRFVQYVEKEWNSRKIS